MYPAITGKLAAGFARVLNDMPWIGGQIINGSPEGQNPLSTESFHAKPRPGSWCERDLRNGPSMATMDTLRQRHFPCSLLHESDIASHPTFQQGAAGSGPEPSVVFAVQAGLISGGIILTFVAHHQVMDLVALGRIMHLLSRVCSGGSLTSEDIMAANLTRYTILPLLLDSHPPNSALGGHSPKATSSRAANTRTAEAPTAPPPNCIWSYFSFSNLSLTSLKTLAMEGRSPKISYISTDDALTVVIWQSITRAWIPRLASDIKSTLTRAVDMRRYFGIPLAILG